MTSSLTSPPFPTRRSSDLTPGASHVKDRVMTLASDAASSGAAKGKAFLRSFLQNERRIFAYILTLLAHRADAADVLQDRKSTRLNSSHLGISYAVFCLKKK